uniref:CBM20 domain-containing protein n=1 Tax=Panagrolaimus sp. JU765 TaxID=591449 RepID=A0AC34R7W5_9BILA
MTTVEFTVHVKEIHPWDNVFVVGSHPKIGNWNPDLALELVPDEQSKIWTNKITVTVDESKKSLQYRYFIGYYLQSSNDPMSKKKIISKWEAQFLPRTLFSGAHMKTGLDEFGFYNGRSKISNGWLHQPNQCEFLLRFHGKALKFFKERYNLKIFSIKVVAFDLRHKEEITYTSERGHFLWRTSSVYVNSVGSIDDDENDSCETPTSLPQLPSFSNIEVADLSGNDPHFKDQSSNGTEFQNGRDFLIFRTKTIASEF